MKKKKITTNLLTIYCESRIILVFVNKNKIQVKKNEGGNQR